MTSAHAGVFPILSILLLAILPITAQDGIEVHAADPSITPAAVQRVDTLAEALLRRLQPTFPAARRRPIRIELHRDAASLAPDLARNLHPDTPGFALLGRDEIHILLDDVSRTPPGDLRTVVAHELVHALLDQQAGDKADLVPRWFHEGLAQVLSGDTYLGANEEQLVYRASIGGLPRFRKLREHFPDDPYRRRLAYAQSYSFVGYLLRRTDLETLIGALPQLRDDDSGYIGAFVRHAGSKHSQILEDWGDYLVHHSGARWRLLFDNCFAYLMIGGFVLLALAVIRRFERDRRVQLKLEREAALAEEQARVDHLLPEPAEPADGFDHAADGADPEHREDRAP